jgi:hypothetical protein
MGVRSAAGRMCGCAFTAWVLSQSVATSTVEKAHAWQARYLVLGCYQSWLVPATPHRHAQSLLITPEECWQEADMHPLECEEEDVSREGRH